jgi:acetyl-CoA acetyltransferase family protein
MHPMDHARENRGTSAARAGDVFIVDAVRTPVGKGHPTKGMFAETHVNELLGTCYRFLIDRNGLDPERVESVIAGCVEQYGEQSINVARNAWLQADLPVTVPAMTVDFQCGSGQQAVATATAFIAAGLIEVAVAGGVEHLGHVPMALERRLVEEAGDPWPLAFREHHPVIPQGEAAEVVADRWEISRDEMDRVSLRSHELAARATEQGRFEDEVVPVAGVASTTDQGIRTTSSLEQLAALPPAFRPNGAVTAGNSSQISDGASALLLMSAGAVEAAALTPLARVVDTVSVGVDPVLMLTGPVDASRLLLERNELVGDEVDVFEVNEAFAAVLAMWQREFDVPPDRVNPNGGAIALGHPLGCSGARLLTTLVHELRRSGGERGVVAMCCRGGLGTGTLVERVG